MNTLAYPVQHSNSASQIAPEILQWIANFRQSHGRAPRMLHIGNIANNAYNNARILRKVGIDCDVICHDYYHVLSCPEWEDADFQSDTRNDFFPAWEQVNLNGFERPEWFVQGPLPLCWNFLITRRQGNDRAASYWRKQLDQARTRHCVEQRGEPPSWRQRIGNWANACLERFRRGRAWLGERRRRWQSQLHATYAPVRARCVPFYNKLQAVQHLHPLPATVYQALRCLVLLAACSRAIGNAVVRLPQRAGTIYPFGTLLVACLRLVYCFLLSIVRLPLLPLEVAFRLTRRAVRRRHPQPLHWPLPGQAFDRMAERLVRRFKVAFPQRRDQLRALDLEPYRSVISGWSELFRHYDIVLGYSTDPILPMLAGVPYLALEHGTLRDIPFQDNPTARLTALAYHLAEHVFVTNSDCYEKGQQLAQNRVTFLNHPFDDDHYRLVAGSGPLREKLLRELDAEHLIFFPTRHDWVPNTGYADKGNDKLLRAFARLIDDGFRVGLVCCEWGKNVAQSRELLQQLNVAQHVKWTSMLGMVAFERMALACDLVADQFHFGIYGGIMLKAMAAGVPVVTFIDEQCVMERFNSMPPVINTPTTDAIYTSLREVLIQPERLVELGRQSRAWIKENYSTQETIHKQLLVVREQLSPRSYRTAA